ncbi:MAG: hypothetical protein D6812_17760 [Deltaproteobacteria bacterium]|nr:MAG: hypothetical protein D6812_17760 [Deltaproteobacteria bacterium]
MSRDCLLLGVSKKKTADARGQFGEGLKLGCLALTRAGIKVKIQTGAEVWSPFIVHSRGFGVDVLAFDIRKRKEPVDGTIVRIHLSKSLWERFQRRFLPDVLSEIDSERKNDLVRASCAPSWYGVRYKRKDGAPLGQVFVKGIWVQDDDNLRYVYDLHGIRINRDRNMVDPSDSLEARAQILRNDLITGGISTEEFWDLIALDSPFRDLMDESARFFSNLPDDVREGFRSRFKALHGELAMAVLTEEQANKIAHWGLKGVITSSVAMMLVEGTLSYETALDWRLGGLRWKEIEKADDHELTWVRGVIDRLTAGARLAEGEVSAKFLVSQLSHLSKESNWEEGRLAYDLSLFSGVYYDRRITGMFFDKGIRGSGPAIILLRGLSPRQKLLTFIHELAHFLCFAQGVDFYDGSVEHRLVIENLWLFYSEGARADAL